MPKQAFKIDQFHGGLSNNSSSKDIADNELYDAKEIAIDKLGQIELMSRAEDHDADAPAVTASTINPGYGLFSFSHDRGNAEQGTSEFIGSGTDFTTGTKWHEEGDFTLSSSKAAYVHSGGTGRLIQNYDNRALTKTGAHDYKLKYTISNSSASKVGYFRVLGEDNSTEILDTEEDRDIDSAPNWAIYDPNSTSFTYAESGGQITITGTTANNPQGATIGTGDFGTLTAGRTYRVDFKAWTTSDPVLGLYVELGGTVSSQLGLVQAASKAAADAYEVNIKAASDSAIKIYYTSATARTWYIDDISIKESHFTSTTVDLPKYNGTHEFIVKGNANNSSKPIVIDVTSSAAGSELITNASDRTFTSGTVNWVEYSPGSTLATYTEDTSTDDRIELVGTITSAENGLSWAKEGAELAQSFIGTLYAGQWYKISAKVYVASGTMVNFFFEMGGTVSESFDISTSTTAIEKYIKIVNTTGSLKIYNKSDDVTGWFIDDVSVSQPAGTFDITDISLTLNNAPHSSGSSSDHYLALSDSDTSGSVHIFSKANNQWGTPITGLDSNASGNYRKDIFHFAEGALRICDTEFGNNNPVLWYSYLDRIWFPNNGTNGQVTEWHLSDNGINPPGNCWHDADTASLADNLLSGTEFTYDWGSNQNYPGRSYPRVTAHPTLGQVGCFEQFGSDAGDNLVNVLTKYTCYMLPEYNGQWLYFTFKCGPYTNPSQGGIGWLEDSTVTIKRRVQFPIFGTANYRHEWFNCDFNTTDMILDQDWGSGNYDVIRAEGVIELYDWGSGILAIDQDWMTWQFVHTQTFREGSGTWPTLGSEGTLLNGAKYVDGNNLVTLWEWDATEGGSGWQNASGDQEWLLGVSFIYDGNQESKMVLSFIEDQQFEWWGYGVNKLPAGDTSIATRPQVFIAIADPSHDGVGFSDGMSWNKRVSGFKLYLQKQGVSSMEPFYLFATGDFYTGELLIEASQARILSQYNNDQVSQSYFFWNVLADDLVTPPSHTTYEMSTGRLLEEKSITCKYKTATLAGKRLYVGNLEIFKDDGTKEYKADGMIKSEPFAYDVFPSNNIIEVSTNDGDEIIALENFADRILQFKRRKMHIINIAQDLEFLEDTYAFKGVKHLSAVCKTDYGIAWANEDGVYLYDGKNVQNLLERKGVRLISASYYSSHLGNEPIAVGFIPKSRQIVVKSSTDNVSSGDNIMLFDLATYSWTSGVDKIPYVDSSGHDTTNFVNDDSGNLIIAHDDGDVAKWGSSPAATSSYQNALSIVTKEYDFGNPSIRKKIYKVYVNYRATGSVSASTNVLCKFGTNGGDRDKLFKDGTNFTSNDLLCTDGEWAQAELKPNTPTQTSSIYSFQLGFTNDGVVTSDFAINDITIIYRIKSVK